MVGCFGFHNGEEGGKEMLVGTAKDDGWTEMVVII